MSRALMSSMPRCLTTALLVVAATSCKSAQFQAASGLPVLTGTSTVSATATGAKDSGDYTIDFGKVAVGQQQSATLSLANSGTSPLTILQIGAPSDPEFSVGLTAGMSVPAGGASDVPVSFKPFNKGSKTATLLVQTDSSTTPNLTLTLQGVGVELNLSVQPELLDFGDLVIHTTSTKPVTLTNLSELDLQITPSAPAGPAAMLFQVAQTSAFTLKAGQAQPIDVTYAPLILSVSDRAYFTLTPDIGAPLTVTLQGVALQGGLQITPSVLDFNFVQPGQQRSLEIHLQNAGNQPINVTSIAVGDSANAFAMASGAPQTARLSGGQGIDVGVTFSPATAQSYQGSLQILSDDSMGQRTVVLQGYGGGAAISCVPLALDFGVAPIGITSVLPVICTNTGSDVLTGGVIDTKAELAISALRVSNGSSVFAGAIDSRSTQGLLKAGQSTQVDVEYTPSGTEQDSATLTIVSNVTAPPAPPVVQLNGQGIHEQKCSYTLTPAAIAFGEVKPGAKFSYTTAFTITNVGANECLVNGVALQPGTDPAFSLPQGVVASQRLSAPGTGGAFPISMSVPVTFAPSIEGSFSGQVAFTISDPDAPTVVVPLSGVGGTSCFIVKPVELNFGVVGLSNGQYCAKGKKSFVGINACAGEVTIQAVNQDNTVDSPFALLNDDVPVTVEPGGTSPPFEVGFKPITPGSYYGSAQVQTDLQPTSLGVFFSGSAAVGSQNTDTFEGHTPKVDVLLVMDTDDDLEDLRVPFSTHVVDFVKAAQTLNLDFQIAVTSSSDCPNSAGNGLTPNGEQGRIIPCVDCNLPGVAPTIVTSADLNAAADVATLVLVNSIERDGCPYPNDDEHFFDVAYKALVYPGPSLDWNTTAGFVRSDAYLSIIQTNGDDEDASDPQTPDWYANQLLSVKGADHPELFSWSYINPSQYGSTGGHTPFDRLPTHIRGLLNLVGGVALDMTQDKWWQGVIDLWNIVLASTSRFPLSGTPDPTTIEVYLDGPPPGQTVDGGLPGVLISPKAPNGATNWSYDTIINAIDVGANLTLSSSDTLYVTYKLVCQ
jgi:hypothetical protein